MSSWALVLHSQTWLGEAGHKMNTNLIRERAIKWTSKHHLIIGFVFMEEPHRKLPPTSLPSSNWLITIHSPHSSQSDLVKIKSCHSIPPKATITLKTRLKTLTIVRKALGNLALPASSLAFVPLSPLFTMCQPHWPSLQNSEMLHPCLSLGLRACCPSLYLLHSCPGYSNSWCILFPQFSNWVLPPESDLLWRSIGNTGRSLYLSPSLIILYMFLVVILICIYLVFIFVYSSTSCLPFFHKNYKLPEGRVFTCFGLGCFW